MPKFLATAALGRSLARSLLGGSLLDCGLASRSLLHCLLHCGLLDCLLSSSPLHGLLRGSPLHGLLDGGLLDGLAGAARRHTTLHCWSFRRELLCARDNRFELSAGPKGRHGGGLNFHRLASARISRHAGCATALFENAEAGNGDTVTLVNRTHDGVDYVLHRRGCLPTIRAQFLREYVDELRFVHAKPPKPVVLFGPTRGHGKPIAH